MLLPNVEHGNGARYIADSSSEIHSLPGARVSLSVVHSSSVSPGLSALSPLVVAYFTLLKHLQFVGPREDAALLCIFARSDVSGW